MLRTLALLLGVALGFTVSYMGPSWATRNSSGTYSLPSGQPVVAGTVISPTVHNTFASDIASELTNSLDRNGRGAMLAPLQCTNGTNAAPSITFSSDADTGIYRIGANNLGITLGGTKYADFSTTTFAWTGTQTISAGTTVTQSTTNGTSGTFTGNGTGAGLACTGGSSSGTGITATGGASNGNAATFLGDGTGWGLQATGGDTSGTGLRGLGGAPNGPGVYGEADGTAAGVWGQGGDSNGHGVVGVGGASNGHGGLFTGDGTGYGVHATGGDNSGVGVAGTGGATNGHGVVGVGTGSGNGGVFTGGGSNATGLTATGGATNGVGITVDGAGTGVAIDIGTGNALFSGTYPSSTTGFTGILTLANFPKALARVSLAAGTPVVTKGFNIASVTCSSNTVKVNIANDMADTSYAAIVSGGGISGGSSFPIYETANTSAGQITVSAFDGDGSGSQIDLCLPTGAFSLVVYGDQ